MKNIVELNQVEMAVVIGGVWSEKDIDGIVGGIAGIVVANLVIVHGCLFLENDLFNKSARLTLQQRLILLPLVNFVRMQILVGGFIIGDLIGRAFGSNKSLTK